MIAMDAHTGAIRAIASYPNFDPNWFVSPNLKAEPRPPALPGDLEDDAAAEPRDHAACTPRLDVQAVHGDRGGESGVLPNIYDTIPCSGKVKIAGHAFNNWDPYANMQMSLPTALSQSCDTYFYELGHRIYNLDKKQGSPLQNWAGAVRLRQADRHRHRRREPGHPADARLAPEDVHQGDRPTGYQVDRLWHPGDSVLLAIGQGALEVTPLQIAPPTPRSPTAATS